jgi:phenylalanyl-tRNA synthetase alpha chain
MASGDLPIQLLQALDKSSPLLSSEAFPNIRFQELKAALDRLASREMIKYDTLDREEAILEPEGEQIAANGSHEARVFEVLRKAVEGLTVQELEKEIGDKNVTKLGQGKAFREKWISKTKGKVVHASRQLDADTVRQMASYRQQKTR